MLYKEFNLSYNLKFAISCKDHNKQPRREVQAYMCQEEEEEEEVQRYK